MKILVAAMLLVCVCPGVHAKEKAADVPKTAAELSVDHGYVRVSMPQWELAGDFSLRARDKKRKDFIPPLKERIGTRSYGGWIPAGDYDVLDSVAVDGSKYLAVTVKPGEITDLGVLLRVPLGGYEYMLVPMRDSESEEEGKTLLATLASVVKSPNVNYWNPTELPRAARFSDASSGLDLIADLIQAYDRKVNKPPLAKQLRGAKSVGELMTLAKSAMPPRVEESAIDASSNLYYGADLGQMRVRHPDGTWGSLDTGVLTEISAVEVSGQQIIAGTLRGQLLSSTDGGQSWRVARALDAHEAILDIDRAGSRWLVLAAPFVDTPAPTGYVASVPGTPRVWTLKDSLHVYSGTLDDFTDLALLKDIPMAPSWYAHWRGASESSVGHVVGGAYLLNTAAGLQKLDVATLAWSMAAKPDHRVDSFRISRDGKLLTAKRLQGAFSKVSVSEDMGGTWKPYSRPPYVVYDVVLDTPDSGIATRWNTNAFGVQLEVYAYDAKVKDWRKSYDAPQGCVQMLRDEHFDQRFCLTNGGSILSRRDNEWVVEFALE
jgi:hypothetical protein